MNLLKYLGLAVCLLALSFARAQTCPQNCNMGSNVYTLQNSSISNITDTSALLTYQNQISAAGVNTVGGDPINVGMFVIWSNDCDLVCEGTNIAEMDSSSLQPVSYPPGYMSLNIYFPMGAQNYGYLDMNYLQLFNLDPGQVYYARVVTFLQDLTTQQNYWCYDKVVTFTTTGTPPDPTLSNNSIATNDMLICPQTGSSIYTSPQIMGSLPKGGRAAYTYQWEVLQLPSAGGKWQKCPQGNQKNFTPVPITNAKMPYTEYLYRRTVKSGTEKNISDTVKLTYVPTGYTPLINLQQVAEPNTDMRMFISADNASALQSITWKNSDITGTVITQNVNVNSPIVDITNIPGQATHVFQALLNYNGTCPAYPSVKIYVSTKDGDGNIYPAVKINNQYWMINNLRTTSFTDGSPINVTKNLQTSTQAAFSWYNNEASPNAVQSGALYNATVINNGNNKNACPEGWRVAGFMDWQKLLINLGGSDQAAGLLKLRNEWQTVGGLLNAYNFNAFPSGECLFDEKGPKYYLRNEKATWWGLVPQEPYDKPNPQLDYYEITDGDNRVYLITRPGEGMDKNAQRSIRCVCE